MFLNLFWSRWMDWSMGNHNAKGHSLWPTHCMPNLTEPRLVDEEDPSGDNSSQSPDILILDNLITNNDFEELEKFVNQTKVDVNVELNEKKETPLIIAVKLSHIECVRVLLDRSVCSKNCLNVNNCSAFDMALITAFDNRREPRHSVCWGILRLLMEANAEPVCKDAMMYTVRTAFKFQDDQFLQRLITTVQECSNSILFHELFLNILHRHQPIYVDPLDPILINMSDFSLKLLRWAPACDLEFIIHSLFYYLECYWKSRRKKLRTFYKLIVYTIAAGWVWHAANVYHISRSCPHLAKWLVQVMKTPFSLAHLSRASFRQHIVCPLPEAIEGLPYPIPQSLKRYLLMEDMDDLCSLDNLNLNDVFF